MFGSTKRPGLRGTNSLNGISTSTRMGRSLGSLSGTVFTEAPLADAEYDALQLIDDSAGVPAAPAVTQAQVQTKPPTKKQTGVNVAVVAVLAIGALYLLTKK